MLSAAAQNHPLLVIIVSAPSTSRVDTASLTYSSTARLSPGHDKMAKQGPSPPQLSHLDTATLNTNLPTKTRTKMPIAITCS